MRKSEEIIECDYCGENFDFGIIFKMDFLTKTCDLDFCSIFCFLRYLKEKELKIKNCKNCLFTKNTDYGKRYCNLKKDIIDNLKICEFGLSIK